MANILVVFYSAFGHIRQMAQSVCEGAKAIEKTDVRCVKIPEFTDRLIPAIRENPLMIDKNGISATFQIGKRKENYERESEKQKIFKTAEIEDFHWADGVIWGFPTYFGSMPSQVKYFLETIGDLCVEGALEGKPAGIFTSAGSIHSGHEAAILTSIVPLLHFGMIIIGLPYTQNPEYLTDAPIGGTPYGPTVLAGPDGSRKPSDDELKMAGRLGRNVAYIANALCMQRERNS
ncbi:NAD(P)H:quinone oxidoreductase [Aeribacillus sp. SP014]